MPQRARHRTRRLDARTWQWSKRTASSSETCSTAATSCASTRAATCHRERCQPLLKVESHVERLLEHRDNPARRERVTAELEEPLTPIDAVETQGALECFREQATDIDEVIATPRGLGAAGRQGRRQFRMRLGSRGQECVRASDSTSNEADRQRRLIAAPRHREVARVVHSLSPSAGLRAIPRRTSGRSKKRGGPGNPSILLCSYCARVSHGISRKTSDTVGLWRVCKLRYVHGLASCWL